MLRASRKARTRRDARHGFELHEIHDRDAAFASSRKRTDAGQGGGTKGDARAKRTTRKEMASAASRKWREVLGTLQYAVKFSHGSTEGSTRLIEMRDKLSITSRDVVGFFLRA